MYLAYLKIEGFRGLESIELNFRSGLNILVGPNNAGKTAVVDALRALLSTGDEGVLRVTDYDLHVSTLGKKSTQCTFKYVFRGLDETEEADFLTALKLAEAKEDGTQEYEAHITVQYSNPDIGGRLRVKRWCGDHEENFVTPEMLEDLRAVYLQPLRDPAQGLKPGRNSQLSRLVQRLSNDASRNEVETILAELDGKLKAQEPIADVQTAITKRHVDMLGEIFSQELAVTLSPHDFLRVAARLALIIANFEVEQNGLGFNNLIYMAIVLSELSVNQDTAYRALIVEEPEAHLHPQLQAVLLQYLQLVEQPKEGEKTVQLFVTSHSPNFAALAEIDSVGCVYRAEDRIEAFCPRNASFDKRTKEKLQRYLNVTRAEILFARRIIFVEGIAELFLVEALASKSGINLRKHSVSIINVDGLNFDAFLPLFGENALKVRIAVITDSDPSENPYPQAADELELSGTAKNIKKYEDKYIKVFFAKKTLEYDLALADKNRVTMLKALKELHPKIEGKLNAEVMAADDNEKAKVLFQGMFERGKERSSNIQKGAFAQALAQAILDDKSDIDVPAYIQSTLDYIIA